MKKLISIKPCMFENYLIISLNSNWINQFGKIPKFDVFIENKKLCIVSVEELK